MGQKVNPHGLRVGINAPWSSTWFANKKDFAKNLKEDNEIRNYLKKNYYDAAISYIKIDRAASNIKIDIYCGRVGVAVGKLNKRAGESRLRRRSRRHHRRQKGRQGKGYRPDQRRHQKDSRTEQELQRQRSRSQTHRYRRSADSRKYRAGSRKEDSLPQSDEVCDGQSHESGRQGRQNDGFRQIGRRRNSKVGILSRGFDTPSDPSRRHRLRLCRSPHHLRHNRRKGVDLQGRSLQGKRR